MIVPHTPGPWEFLEASDTEGNGNAGKPLTICEVVGDHNDIANVYSSDNATVSITRAEAIANARLIAAAPDLLQALRVLVASRRWAGGNWHIELALAVIAKAEGRTP